MNSDLSSARAEIDRIDAEILNLFARRMELGKEIGKFKVARHLPVCNPEREREILLHIARSAGRELSSSARILFSTLLRLVMSSLIFPWQLITRWVRRQTSPLLMAITTMAQREQVPLM